MVRLSFHDCVGGCDGCINIENDSNNGLADLIDALDLVYTDNDFGDILSRADHWAIMGIWAVQSTIDNAVSNGYAVPDLAVEYTYGRTVGFYKIDLSFTRLFFSRIVLHLPTLLTSKIFRNPPSTILIL